MRTTRRTGPTPENNYAEIVAGDAPSSIEIAINAKGLAQPTIKLYYPSADELEERAPEQLARILATIQARFPTPKPETRPEIPPAKTPAAERQPA
jgi:hypothetical protein